MKSLARKFYNETARLENMVLLASVLGEIDSMPEVMEEDFLQEGIEDMVSCFGPMPDEIKEAYELEDYSEFLGWLLDNDRFGFLLKFATPVMKPSASGNGASYSWGHYRMKWVYGDTLDAALDSGFAWVEECRNMEKAEAGL